MVASYVSRNYTIYVVEVNVCGSPHQGITKYHDPLGRKNSMDTKGLSTKSKERENNYKLAKLAILAKQAQLLSEAA